MTDFNASEFDWRGAIFRRITDLVHHDGFGSERWLPIKNYVFDKVHGVHPYAKDDAKKIRNLTLKEVLSYPYSNEELLELYEIFARRYAVQWA